MSDDFTAHMLCMLQTILTSALGSPSEDVKAVASQALGGVAIGNLSTYLPFILQQIQSQVTSQSRCMRYYAACFLAMSAAGADLQKKFQSGCTLNVPFLGSQEV